MTVPYSTPGATDTGRPGTGASLDACLAAAELIDQYLGAGSLAYETATLNLRAFYKQGVNRWVVALPHRPIIEAVVDISARERGTAEVDAAIERTLAAPDAVYSPIGRITTRQVDYLGRVNIDAIWGWPTPDRANTRTMPIAELLDGDVEASATIKEEITTAPGECWFLFKAADRPEGWHCETAYVKDDGTLERYAEASGTGRLDGGMAQRVVWPAGLAEASGTAARRLEQLKKSPGFKGYDSPGAQAVLHQITRSLDRFRP